MSEQTARLVDRLRTRLRHAVRRITRAEVAFGVATAAGTAAGLWLVSTLLEANFWLGPVPRTLLIAATILGVGYVSATMLARPLGTILGLIEGPSEEEIARAVGAHHPEVADRLVNALHLAKGNRSRSPAPLVDQAVQELAGDLETVSFEAVEDFSAVRRAARLASLPLLGLLAFLLAAPSTFLDASERLLAPGTEFSRPAPFTLSVSPGDARLVRGDTLQVSVRGTGRLPDTATLLLRDSTGATERVPLEAGADGTFEHAVPNVRRPLRYRLVVPPVRTDWYRISVSSRPRVRQLQLTVVPPAYTGTSPRTLNPNVGDVSALPGARVGVSAEVGGAPVETATLTFESGRTNTLSVEDGTAEGTFVLRSEDTYQIRLQSKDGVSNRAPIRYQAIVREDARPAVSFITPDTPTSIEADLRQPLEVQVEDDYGVQRMALFYRLRGSTQSDAAAPFDSIEVPLPASSLTSETVTYEWLLAQDSGLAPEPGDDVAYYVAVWDNDTVNGPKRGRTRTQRLRRPSLTDKYERLDQTRDTTEKQLDDLRERSDSARQQFQQLRRELRRTRSADWQDERKLERIQQKQESIRRGAQSLSRQLEQMTRQMQQGDLSSPETTQRLEELRKIADNLSSPELQEALQELKKALSQDDPRKMQNTLERVREQQRQSKDRLERIQELYEQLKAQQDLEELSNRTKNLQERQEALEEKTEARRTDSADTSMEDRSPGDVPPDSSSRPSADERQSDPQETGESNAANEDLAREQEQAAEDMEDLLERLQEAEQEMKDVPSSPSKELKKMNEQLRQENLPEQMQQNSQQLRQNQLQDAQQGQQQMQQRLGQMQQRLNQMQQGMQQQQQRMNVTGLRTALERTLRLSKEQESLRNEVQDLATDGPALRRYARSQKQLSDGFNVVSDSLSSIARRVPQMEETVREETGRVRQAMESALTALDNRESQSATGHQKTSMMHLNELALLLSDLLNSMQQQSSGQAMTAQQMMQQLQQMSGQQQKLNQQIQKHLNESQGERLSRPAEDRRKQLAKQQRKLQKQLQEMDVGSEAEEQILGDLEKIGEQMEEAAEALEDGRRRREINERQQQILTRLLNAQKSLRTQGKQDQRRGEQATGDTPRRSPDALPDPEDTDTLRRDLIRALEMGYSADYEELIRRYFDLLQEQAASPESPQN